MVGILADRKTGLRVVFAEDNETSLKIGASILRKSGCVVMPASNGLEAVQMLAENESDLVLLDLEMPVCDGYEAVRKIRSGAAGQEKSSIPVVALTAHNPEEITVQCKDAGFDGFVTKPLRVDELDEVLFTINR
jgi:two-component system, sensor histidine kinase